MIRVSCASVKAVREGSVSWASSWTSCKGNTHTQVVMRKLLAVVQKGCLCYCLCAVCAARRHSSGTQASPPRSQELSSTIPLQPQYERLQYVIHTKVQ